MEPQEFKTIGNKLQIMNKNEQKTPLFIFLKHAIEDMNESNADRIYRYIENYCKTNALQSDKLEIRAMFKQKLQSLC